MMTDHQTALVSLLLGSFPNFQSGDAEAALAAYEIVMSEADERDLQPGIMLIINGKMPGFDGRFAPTAPQLSRAFRIALERRVDEENSRRSRLPKPNQELPEDPPEVKAKNKARLDALVESLGRALNSDTAETERKAREFTNRVNARFHPALDSRSMAERLHLDIDLGDDGADGDMGQRGAA